MTTPRRAEGPLAWKPNLPGWGRRTPIYVAPLQHETLDSWVVRYAAAHDVPLGAALRRLGAIRSKHARTPPVGWGVVWPPDTIDQVATVSGVPPQVLEAMVMARWHGVAADLSDITSGDGRSIRRAAVREWLRLAGSWLCGPCLDEDEFAWNLTWKVAPTFACTRHRLLLAAICPRCNQPFGLGRQGGLAPTFMGRRPPTPGTCRNPSPDAAHGRGAAALPCGYPLTDVEQPPTACDHVETAQRWIDRRLAGEHATVGGSHHPPMLLFRLLRSTVALILATATTQDLLTTNPRAIERFQSHTDQRNEIETTRRELVANGIDHRKGRRNIHYRGQPTDPTLAAAAISQAIHVLSADGPTELVVQLEPLAQRAREAFGRNATNLLTRYRFEQPLSDAFVAALARASRRAPIALAVKDPTQHPPSRLEGRHVPQMLWTDVFEEAFAPLLPKVRPHIFAEFCALALAKQLTNSTWNSAGDHLCIDHFRPHRRANAIITQLRQAGTEDQFVDRLEDLIQRLEGAATLVDYRHREQRLDNWRMDDHEWAKLRSSLALPGHRSTLRAHLDAEVWQLATSRWIGLAPALRDYQRSSATEYRRNHVTPLMAPLRPQLIELACEMVRPEPLNPWH